MNDSAAPASQNGQHTPPRLTVEEFVVQTHDQPLFGQRVDLERGSTLPYDGPTDREGIAVRNLSKAFATWMPQQMAEQNHIVGMAVFEPLLVLERDPDTAWRPAMGFFHGESSFGLLDQDFHERPPTLVLERRSRFVSRSENVIPMEWLARYFVWGVESVWMLDAKRDRELVHQITKTGDVTTLEGRGTLTDPVISNFSLTIQQLYHDPDAY